MNATFEDVVKLAEQLDLEQQNLLIYRLRIKQARQTTSPEPTRESLIEELDSLRTGNRFVNTASLYGKYARPDAAPMTEEELHAALHAIATEWEQELDEFNP